MNRVAAFVVSVVGLLLGLTGGELVAAPITGQFTNHNPSYGGNAYRFEDHPKSVFVLHHFEVEVC